MANQSESMARTEVNSPLIITTGIISVLLLVVSAVGLEAWFRYEEQSELNDKWVINQNTWLADIRTKEASHINAGYHWTDDKKSVAMPIDEAIRQVGEKAGKTR